MSEASVTRTPLAGNPLVVIQARLTSERLPRKVLADIGGKPLIQHVWERANAIEGIADVVVAVPDHATRTELIAIGLPAAKVVAFPQVKDENDVLGRFAACAREWKSHDFFVRITADTPLLAPEIGADVLRERDRGGFQYHTNVLDGYIDGTDIECFGRTLLLTDADTETDRFVREHVTPAMRERYGYKSPPSMASALKLSVDDLDDLERVRAIYDALADTSDYSLAATLRAAERAGV